MVTEFNSSLLSFQSQVVVPSNVVEQSQCVEEERCGWSLG